MACMAGPEFERVAATGDAGEGVAGQGVVAALLVCVELQALRLCGWQSCVNSIAILLNDISLHVRMYPY